MGCGLILVVLSPELDSGSAEQEKKKSWKEKMQCLLSFFLFFWPSFRFFRAKKKSAGIDAGQLSHGR